MKLAKMASAAVLPFAHLLGVRAASEDDCEDDEKKKAKAAKAKADDSDDEKDEKKEKDDAAKAKADGDGPTDGDEDDDKKKAKGKKAKAEDDDDEGDANAKAAAWVGSAHAARAARIVAHGINTGTVRQACAFAFDSEMTAEAAIANLDAAVVDRGAAPAARGASLAERMAAEPVANVAPEGVDASASMGNAETVAAMVQAAVNKARGKA